MSESTVASLRAALVAERERVVAQLEEFGLDHRAYDENFADSALVTAERGEVDAIVGSLRESLADVDAALEKLDDGSYGRCEACGDPIAAARLEAMPAARLCIGCASKRR